MFKVILGHFKKGQIILSNEEVVSACPYNNILAEITDTKGFYLLYPFANNPNAYAIKNYVLVDDERYAELTEN